MRLQKYLADCGVASRRASEGLIAAGKVKVNGVVVTEMGTQVTPGKDIVSVDGKRIAQPARNAYFIFYKPRGVVSTVSDDRGRKCVTDFFKQQKRRLYPVGRLDLNSEGLLLVTDDGEFANLVMHPKNGVQKIYRVTLSASYSMQKGEELKAGVDIGDETPAQAIDVVFRNRTDGRSSVDITLIDGRNHQVRRMFEAQGFEVLKLKRMQIGALELGDMKPGTSQRITYEEAMKACDRPKTGRPTWN